MTRLEKEGSERIMQKWKIGEARDKEEDVRRSHKKTGIFHFQKSF